MNTATRIASPLQVIDWNNIAPHPALEDIARRCASCGAERGDHGAAAPFKARGCRGFRPIALRGVTKGGRP
jgi:hypothetical protein